MVGRSDGSKLHMHGKDYGKEHGDSEDHNKAESSHLWMMKIFIDETSDL